MITNEQAQAFIDFILEQPFKPFGCNDISDVKSALEAYEASKWISVNDRLPNDGDIVISFSSTGIIEENIFYEKNRFPEQSNNKFMFGISQNITHWQPLPTAPKT